MQEIVRLLNMFFSLPVMLAFSENAHHFYKSSLVTMRPSSQGPTISPEGNMILERNNTNECYLNFTAMPFRRVRRRGK